MNKLGTGKVGILCLAGLALLVFTVSVTPAFPVQNARAGLNDFLASYVGAVLLGTPELYSAEARLRVEKEKLGWQYEPSPALNRRLPFYGLLLKPLTALPYITAYLVFQTASFCAILTWIAIFARRTPEVAVLASVCVPAAAVLVLGQDTGMAALAYAAFFLLSERGRDFLAGLALSLCLIKPHFFPLTAIALLLRREWSVVAGAAAGCSTLVALSFGVAGAHWPEAWAQSLVDPHSDPRPQIMPNLHGFVTVLGWNRSAEGILMALVVAAFAVVVLRGSGRPLIYSLALVCGLLVSVHAYLYDAILLLLALGILGKTMDAGAFRALLTIALTPVPYALLLFGSKLSIALVCLLLAAVAAAALAVLRPGISAGWKGWFSAEKG